MTSEHIFFYKSRTFAESFRKNAVQHNSLTGMGLFRCLCSFLRHCSKFELRKKRPLFFLGTLKRTCCERYWGNVLIDSAMCIMAS